MRATIVLAAWNRAMRAAELAAWDRAAAACAAVAANPTSVVAHDEWFVADLAWISLTGLATTFLESGAAS